MTDQKLLFTPGPLSTSITVKEAMLRDVGSRDHLFVRTVHEIREELLRLAHVSQGAGYETVIIQGSGTFGVESVISSVIGPEDTILVLVNGAYGERIVKMAEVHHLRVLALRFEEHEAVDVETVEKFLQANGSITHVACIHCETTTGLINPIAELGAVCRKYGKVFIVDAMSSFGGMDIHMDEDHIDFLLSSSNKCIEGIPGFAFAICNRQELEKARGQARSLSLDLHAQWKGLEENGQFRFTPPTLAIMAFRQALLELEQEGGIPARESRYRANKSILDRGMKEMGFQAYLQPAIQGHIISSFLYPEDPNFSFEDFYDALNEQGFVIYPGKLSKANAFRIGNIGQIFPGDVLALLDAIRIYIDDKKIHVSEIE
jgi:2-aminoethylphosphonate-pyruvate transaminase